jgi:hypothetical protein
VTAFDPLALPMKAAVVSRPPGINTKNSTKGNKLSTRKNATPAPKTICARRLSRLSVTLHLGDLRHINVAHIDRIHRCLGR